MINKEKIIFIVGLLLVAVNSQCLEGCYECQKNNCIACLDEYERTVDGRCIKPSIQNCILYGTESICFKCRPTFKLINNQCVKQYSGCVRYGTNNKCIQCGYGTRLINDACNGVLNCLNMGNQCTQCREGYKIQGNMCKLSSTQNCAEVDMKSGTCKKCLSNFILSGYDCVPSMFDPEFCYIYDSKGKCMYCKQGFTNIQGVCYTSGEIQKVYNGVYVKERRVFKLNYKLNEKKESIGIIKINDESTVESQNQNISITKKSGISPIDKCLQYDPTFTICTACIIGYKLVNQACFYAIEGCQTYEQVGKTVICKKCSTEFELEPSTNICLLREKQDVKNCFIPALNKEYCIVCNAGFNLISGQCVSIVSKNQKDLIGKKYCASFDEQSKKCKTCETTNFRLQNGICLDINCLKFSSTTPNQCEQCKPFFILNSAKGICQYKDSNCELAIQQRCSQCKNNYFITNDGYCAQIPPGCQIPNTKTSLCSICQSGFVLLPNFTCKQQQPVQNCQQLSIVQNSINKCALCIDGFYPSFDICKKVSTRCNGYDKDTGACLKCMAMFEFNKGKCSDPNCAKQSPNEVDKCDLCKDGFKFKNGLCRFDDQNCQVILDNTCKQCFQDYQFSKENNQCVKIQKSQIPKQVNQTQQKVQQKPKQGSSIVNTTNKKIQNCAFQNPINPNICLECQKSYKLSSDLSKCVVDGASKSVLEIRTPSQEKNIISPLVPSIQKDPNCQAYSQLNQNKCQKCAQRFYLNAGTGKCTEVNNLCNSFDQKNGACLSCFDGFYLQNAKCFVKVQIDPYCIQKSNTGCALCAIGYFIDKNKNYTCQKMSQLCLAWNNQTGKCLSCKQGYTLIERECIILAEDPYCKQFQLANNKQLCKTCEDHYFLNPTTSKCQGINQNCKTYNKQTGECYTCKDGYKISKGLCQSSLTMETFVRDYFCKTVQNSICKQCYSGYYLNLDNVCKMKNPICKEIKRDNGDCVDCYPGYYLKQGACIIPSTVQPAKTNFNKNCKRFTSDKIDSCQECYPGYRVVKRLCIEVNPLCKKYDETNGLCTECYKGYYLQNGNCLMNMANNPNELDPYCTELSTDFTNCIKCAPGYFVANDGFCQAFNTTYQCQTYNPQNGKCLSCPYIYVMSWENICIPEIKNCKEYNSQTKCVQCEIGFYLKENQCFPRDIKCLSYDVKSGECNQCISGHFLVDNQCIFPTFGFDKFCAKYVNSYCTECKLGSYLFNYRCREIDSNCLKFDYQAKRCLQCKNSLKPKGISCVAEN